MILEWIISFALTVVETLLAPLKDLPDFNYGAGAAYDFIVPVPVMGIQEINLIETWLESTLIIWAALVVGRVLQWAYQLIPAKMT